MKFPKAFPTRRAISSFPLSHRKGTEEIIQASALTQEPTLGSSSADVSLHFQHFFEGVKARVAQGVKEEEISFQLAYSKQELRKVIERYPGKEVKRALETLYRKIHKYLSPEENLFPVTAVRSVYDVTTF